MTIIEKYLHSFETYTNGGLNTVEKQAFEKRLTQDSAMNNAWGEYRSMMEAFSDKEAIRLRIMLNQAFSKQQNQKIKQLTDNLWFRLSAAAVIIIIMGGLLYFFCSGGQPIEQFAGDPLNISSDSAQIISNEAPQDSIMNEDSVTLGLHRENNPEALQLASLFDKEEYQISPVFAELLHNVYRSGWFGLKTPEDSVRFSQGDSLIFSWETNIKDSLYFDVLDRNGRVIYQYPEAVTSPWSYTPGLASAIYMYRFATEDGPVWMGVMVGI